MSLTAKDILAVAATLVVAYLGYLQWKRTKRSGSFLTDKESAYKGLWLALEEVHLYVRTNEFQRDRFDNLVTAANAQLLKAGLHIEPADAANARSYLDALRRLGRLLATLPPDDAFRYDVATTGAGASVPPSYVDAWQSYESARDVVIAGFRNALGAGQI